MPDPDPNAPAPPAPPAPPADPPKPPEDPAAELAKWKEMARKHEERAKANASAATELEKLKQQSMSDTEKAVAQAKTDGRLEALKEAGTRLVDAEVKAAAAGRDIDVPVLLQGLDRTAFLDADGNPDTKAITAWVDKLAPATNRNANGRPDTGQGNRGQAPPATDMNQLIRQSLGRG